MRRRVVALAIVVPVVTVPPLAGAKAEAQHKCEINAYTIDEDPKGINIRAAASGQAKIAGVIPRLKDDDVGVAIAAESNGWFRIKSFEHYSNSKVVKIDGWVHGSRLASSLMVMQGPKASERLREEPSDRSKTLLLLAWDPGPDGKLMRLTAELPWGKREIIDYNKIKNAGNAVLLACRNGWVKIRVHKYQGWVPKDRLCGNPVTTCN